jgi:hypothetical protein
VATRGSISETFGRPTTPAAVQQGQPLTLVVPAGVDAISAVNLEPLGRVPTAASTAYHFDKDNISVTIPTSQLAPGEAYASELTPGQEYQVLLFQNVANGSAKPVGRAATFSVTPALPH